MDWNELEPQNKKSDQKNLETMSIQALGEYIEELEAEIARVCETITLKEVAKDGAESVFKS